MAFSNLKIKTRLRKIAIKEYERSEAKDKNFGAFKSGYGKGFNDCLRWIMKIYKVKDVGKLKKLSKDYTNSQLNVEENK